MYVADQAYAAAYSFCACRTVNWSSTVTETGGDGGGHVLFTNVTVNDDDLLNLANSKLTIERSNLHWLHVSTDSEGSNYVDIRIHGAWIRVFH